MTRTGQSVAMQSLAAGCSRGADAVIDFFVAMYAALTHDAFSGPDNPQKLPLPVGIWTPSNTWLLGHTGTQLHPSHPKTASRSVQPFLEGTSV